MKKFLFLLPLLFTGCVTAEQCSQACGMRGVARTDGHKICECGQPVKCVVESK